MLNHKERAHKAISKARSFLQEFLVNLQIEGYDQTRYDEQCDKIGTALDYVGQCCETDSFSQADPQLTQHLNILKTSVTPLLHQLQIDAGEKVTGDEEGDEIHSLKAHRLKGILQGIAGETSVLCNIVSILLIKQPSTGRTL